jgi:hypothetical protein
MANLPKQIIGSFEDIGKDIISETVKVPTEIVGKALESLGMASSNQTKTNAKSQATNNSAEPKSKDNWDHIDAVDNKAVKTAISRAALEALVARKGQKELSVRERNDQEEAQKKQAENKANAENAAKELPKMSFHAKPGNLYGMKAKKSPTEISKNVKSE